MKFDKAVSELTNFAISVVLALVIPDDPGAISDIFSKAASDFKSVALIHSPTLKDVAYTRTISRNKINAPLEYFYKHVIEYKIPNKSVFTTVYQTETLL